MGRPAQDGLGQQPRGGAERDEGGLDVERVRLQVRLPGREVLSIAKPSYLEYCLGKKIRQAELRHLVINIPYEENLIRATVTRMEENKDIDGVFVSLKHDDYAGALLYLEMGFEEEKPAAPEKQDTLSNKLLSLALKKLGLQKEPSRRKLIYHFSKDLKEE